MHGVSACEGRERTKEGERGEKRGEGVSKSGKRVGVQI
jgi:hypothetical protein